MKTRIALFLISFSLITDSIHGVPDGMVACAWGTHNISNVSYDEQRMAYNEHLINDSVDEDDVKFYLYNSEYPFPFQLFLGDKERLAAGNFDSRKETKIIIHGYGSNRDSNSCVIPRDAFLKAGHFNVIVVAWDRAQHWGINHAIPIPYPQVVDKLKGVANLVTQLLTFLEEYGVNLNDVTIVGHSLGAHVAGIASHNLQRKVYNIIGLDPAGPYFSKKGPGESLTKEDATRVEVIHTDIEECGLRRQLGHYDFYPNGGKKQPGCDRYKCSHSRSYRFYAESLTTTVGFYARKCDDWESMQQGNCNGERVLMGGFKKYIIPEGIYYLKTNDESPYALGS